MDVHKSLLREIYEDNDSWEVLWYEWFPKWQEKSQGWEAYDIRDEQLALLITYGDSLKDADGKECPLSMLYRFLDEMCDMTIKGVHVLPYSPYTSDDGFSISDYIKVRESLGTWRDIEHISGEYHLMTDLVLNHCSSQHVWFQKFLKGEEPYTDYFITGDPHEDYSSVVRPRPHFILSEYDTTVGKKYVWTTFSRDQVDLNFANPQVLFEMLDTMLEYVLDHNSQLIRLDAIAYMWKELGTPCIHHWKTHLLVKLMRAILDTFAPGAIIITETNVPHEENISYFGDDDEAQMVYQFPLPPLLLHSMITESTKHLRDWVASVPQPTKNISYFNFCASHDGIGVTPTHGILSDKEREKIIETVKKRGGLVSYKATPKGEIPYELNINYLSAVAPYGLADQERAKIFLASQSVLLAMPGVPGIYIHSLIGSQNWNYGVKETGHNRSINRQQLKYQDVVSEIMEEGTLRNLVFNGYIDMLSARAKSPAFHPAAPMQVLEVKDGLFSLIRDGTAVNSDEKVLCVVNVTAKEIVQDFQADILPWSEGGVDLLTGDITFFSNGRDKAGHKVVSVTLEPFEVIWLKFKIEI